ncbi:MAG: recombinase family protein [Pseudomonadota bacterium]
MHRSFPAVGATPPAGERIPVVQYVRMSTEHQKYSTDNQGATIAEYAGRHGMEIIRTYVDSGKSGLNLRGRTGLQRLLHDVQQPTPGFRAILVYDVSRWGRFPDPDEAAVYEHTCKRQGIRVIYCAESFSNDGSLSSTVLVGIKRSMAAEFSRELSVKVFAGHSNLVGLGFRQGGAPGLGLRRQLLDEHNNIKGLLSRGEKKSIQTDRVVLVPGPPQEIALVHRIYGHFLDDGMPERVIASTLNREAILSDAGTVWSRATIHQILTNEKYIGNNVYNRTSFKLKIKHARNSPVDWIRKDGAFEAIVSLEQFHRVQEIIAARWHHLDDFQMLELLKKILIRYGGLSGFLIDEEDDIPSSSAYRSRFGSLLRAYDLVGFTPKRDYAYLEINRLLRKRHPDQLVEMISAIEEQGGWVVRDLATDLLTINGELTVSVVIARCQITASGKYRWRIRLDTSLEPHVTVVVRMNHDNQRPFDYYVLPSIDFSSAALPLLEDNGFILDAYRMDGLEFFYTLTGRVPLEEMT